MVNRLGQSLRVSLDLVRPGFNHEVRPDLVLTRYPQGEFRPGLDLRLDLVLTRYPQGIPPDPQDLFGLPPWQV